MVFQDGQLIFRCFEGKNNYKKDFDKELIKRLLINLFCYQEKMFIIMNTWIVGKDFMRNHCLIKKLFIVVLIWKI